jgi:hypothetical protein
LSVLAKQSKPFAAEKMNKNNGLWGKTKMAKTKTAQNRPRKKRTKRENARTSHEHLDLGLTPYSGNCSPPIVENDQGF